jgi:hypothetical protein
MKYFSLLFIMLLPILITAQIDIEQEYGPPEERAKIMTDSFTYLLPLSEAQYSPVYQVNLKYAQIIQKEVFDKNLSTINAYYKIFRINNRKEKELLPLLNDQQKDNYQALKQRKMKSIMDQFF